MDGRAWKKAISDDERVLCIALSACIVRYKSPRMLRGENKYSGANRIVIRQFQFQTARTLLPLTLITLTDATIAWSCGVEVENYRQSIDSFDISVSINLTSRYFILYSVTRGTVQSVEISGFTKSKHI